MLKMMIPEGAVRQAIQKEGKDVNILEMDPNKSYASQKSTQKEAGPPLKDDPEYQVSSAEGYRVTSAIVSLIYHFPLF